MIESVRFQKKVRDIFKRGQTISLRPFTILVGDNGCGKSTFLNCFSSFLTNCKPEETEGRLLLSHSEPKLERFLFADFEKDNCRTSGVERAGIYGAWANLTMSHGETVMDEMVHHFSKMEKALILLDEPDQCLSPRSAYRMYGILDKIVKENGCQVVMSCHSVPFMEMAGEVLSLEHRRWMPYQKFLELEKQPAILRWVDEDEKFKEPAVLVHLSNGMDKYFATVSDSFCGPPYNKDVSYAKAFKNKDAAQKKAASLVGKTISIDVDFGERGKVKIESAEVVMLNKTFD